MAFPTGDNIEINISINQEQAVATLQKFISEVQANARKLEQITSKPLVQRFDFQVARTPFLASPEELQKGFTVTIRNFGQIISDELYKGLYQAFKSAGRGIRLPSIVGQLRGKITSIGSEATIQFQRISNNFASGVAGLVVTGTEGFGKVVEELQNSNDLLTQTIGRYLGGFVTESGKFHGLEIRTQAAGDAFLQALKVFDDYQRIFSQLPFSVQRQMTAPMNKLLSSISRVFGLMTEQAILDAAIDVLIKQIKIVERLNDKYAQKFKIASGSIKNKEAELMNLLASLEEAKAKGDAQLIQELEKEIRATKNDLATIKAGQTKRSTKYTEKVKQLKESGELLFALPDELTEKTSKQLSELSSSLRQQRKFLASLLSERERSLTKEAEKASSIASAIPLNLEVAFRNFSKFRIYSIQTSNELSKAIEKEFEILANLLKSSEVKKVFAGYRLNPERFSQAMATFYEVDANLSEMFERYLNLERHLSYLRQKAATEGLTQEELLALGEVIRQQVSLKMSTMGAVARLQQIYNYNTSGLIEALMRSPDIFESWAKQVSSIKEQATKLSSNLSQILVRRPEIAPFITPVATALDELFMKVHLFEQVYKDYWKQISGAQQEFDEAVRRFGRHSKEARQAEKKLKGVKGMAAFAFGREFLEVFSEITKSFEYSKQGLTSLPRKIVGMFETELFGRMSFAETETGKRLSWLYSWVIAWQLFFTVINNVSRALNEYISAQYYWAQTQSLINITSQLGIRQNQELKKAFLEVASAAVKYGYDISTAYKLTFEAVQVFGSRANFGKMSEAIFILSRLAKLNWWEAEQGLYPLLALLQEEGKKAGEEALNLAGAFLYLHDVTGAEADVLLMSVSQIADALMGFGVSGKEAREAIVFLASQLAVLRKYAGALPQSEVERFLRLVQTLAEPKVMAKLSIYGFPTSNLTEFLKAVLEARGATEGLIKGIISEMGLSEREAAIVVRMYKLRQQAQENEGKEAMKYFRLIMTNWDQMAEYVTQRWADAFNTLDIQLDIFSRHIQNIFFILMSLIGPGITDFLTQVNTVLNSTLSIITLLASWLFDLSKSNKIFGNIFGILNTVWKTLTKAVTVFGIIIGLVILKNITLAATKLSLISQTISDIRLLIGSVGDFLARNISLTETWQASLQRVATLLGTTTAGTKGQQIETTTKISEATKTVATGAAAAGAAVVAQSAAKSSVFQRVFGILSTKTVGGLIFMVTSLISVLSNFIKNLSLVRDTSKSWVDYLKVFAVSLLESAETIGVAMSFIGAAAGSPVLAIIGIVVSLLSLLTPKIKEWLGLQREIKAVNLESAIQEIQAGGSIVANLFEVVDQAYTKYVEKKSSPQEFRELLELSLNEMSNLTSAGYASLYASLSLIKDEQLRINTVLKAQIGNEQQRKMAYAEMAKLQKSLLSEYKNIISQYKEFILLQRMLISSLSVGETSIMKLPDFGTLFGEYVSNISMALRSTGPQRFFYLQQASEAYSAFENIATTAIQETLKAAEYLKAIGDKTWESLVAQASGAVAAIYAAGQIIGGPAKRELMLKTFELLEGFKELGFVTSKQTEKFLQNYLKVMLAGTGIVLVNLNGMLIALNETGRWIAQMLNSTNQMLQLQAEKLSMQLYKQGRVKSLGIDLSGVLNKLKNISVKISAGGGKTSKGGGGSRAEQKKWYEIIEEQFNAILDGIRFDISYLAKTVAFFRRGWIENNLRKVLSERAKAFAKRDYTTFSALNKVAQTFASGIREYYELLAEYRYYSIRPGAQGLVEAVRLGDEVSQAYYEFKIKLETYNNFVKKFSVRSLEALKFRREVLESWRNYINALAERAKTGDVIALAQAKASGDRIKVAQLELENLNKALSIYLKAYGTRSKEYLETLAEIIEKKAEIKEIEWDIYKRINSVYRRLDVVGFKPETLKAYYQFLDALDNYRAAVDMYGATAVETFEALAELREAEFEYTKASLSREEQLLDLMVELGMASVEQKKDFYERMIGLTQGDLLQQLEYRKKLKDLTDQLNQNMEEAIGMPSIRVPTAYELRRALIEKLMQNIQINVNIESGVDLRDFERLMRGVLNLEGGVSIIG